MTFREAFALAGFDLHPGYGSLTHIPMEGCSDWDWVFQDFNLDPSTYVFDVCKWTPVSDEYTDGAAYTALDLSLLPVTKANVDRLPDIVKDALDKAKEGR
jgi:hypothetical protein